MKVKSNHIAEPGKIAGDTISRQDAIYYCYALINAENPSDPSDEWNYSQERINQTEAILHHLEFMPSAPPVQPKHGKWHIENNSYVVLDVCDQCMRSVRHVAPFYDFCPHCGAKMER